MHLKKQPIFYVYECHVYGQEDLLERKLEVMASCHLVARKWVWVSCTCSEPLIFPILSPLLKKYFWCICVGELYIYVWENVCTLISLSYLASKLQEVTCLCLLSAGIANIGNCTYFVVSLLGLFCFVFVLQGLEITYSPIFLVSTEQTELSP